MLIYRSFSVILSIYPLDLGFTSMKLTELERKILGTAHLKANATIAELAKLIGCREHTVRNCLARVEQEKLLTKRTMVDVHALGLNQYSIFFSAIHRDRKSQLLLQAFILESSITSDVFGLGGDFQYGVVLTVNDIEEVRQFLDSLAKIPGISIVEKSISIRISTTIYQRSYLLDTIQERQEITYSRSSKYARLDEIDHRLLAALNGIEHKSLRELSNKMSIPHSTLTQRYNRLVDAGVIIGTVYGMSSQMLGMQAFRLLVYTKGFDFEALESLHRFALKNPHVLCLFQMIGSWDYEFEIEVSQAQDTFNVAQEIYEVLADRIITVKTVPLLSFPKSTGYPFSMKFQEQFESGYTQ
jgi:DNA-binding Lrp family transcriptional regulator